jgi:hypothetical protein
MLGVRNRLDLEVAVEHTDWLDAGFDPAQARFLMGTAITHHRFSSRVWGEEAVRKLGAELREIEDGLRRELEPVQPSPDARSGDLPLDERTELAPVKDC